MLFIIAHNAILMVLQPKTPLLYHREFTASSAVTLTLRAASLQSEHQRDVLHAAPSRDLFAVAFDARHKAQEIRATAVHPNSIMTELVRYLSEGALEAMEAQINAQAAAAGKPPFEFKTVPQGTATSVWAGVVAFADAMGGHYCEDCHVAPVIPNDAPKGLLDEGVRAYAIDPAHAEALWAKS